MVWCARSYRTHRYRFWPKRPENASRPTLWVFPGRARCVAARYVAVSQKYRTTSRCIAMNSTTDVTTARANKKRSVGLRRASSLLGGALLGTSIVTPILAGGNAVDGDAFVILLSGMLALAGIVVHFAGSGGTAHAR